MKYGLAFSLVAATLSYYAVRDGSWAFLLLWPALSSALVAVAYFVRLPAIFGKRRDGSMRPVNVALLLPYLLYLWGIWHIIRLISRESAVDFLEPDVFVGRRLLPHELAIHPKVIVDLTCEFPEPSAIRAAVKYISFPVLDASTPDTEAILNFAQTLSSQEHPIFIHCAQGHGRTALIASALLLARGLAKDTEDALSQVQAVRPLAQLNGLQSDVLRQTASQMS
ncbi:MAG: phosphatase domain-containing protein [Planctomycetota bacterium]|jgi:hypothetical protein